MRSITLKLGLLLMSAAPLFAQSADFSITKTDSPDPIAGGNNLEYVIIVRNNGPNDATNVVLNDVVPAGTTWSSKFFNGGVPATACTEPAAGSSSGAFNCTFAMFPSGSMTQFTLTVTVNPTASGTISNTATVSSATSDPDGTNNSATATTTVIADADMTITKTDSADPVQAGTDFDYQITITNAGPGTAQNVVLDDPIPAGTTFVSSFYNGGALGSCTQPPAGGTGSFHCTYATLMPSQNSIYSITVHVNPAASGTLSNTATVTTTSNDPVPANNTATETTAITSLNANLSVTKTDSPDPVTAGQNITYTITVANAGPDTATNVQLQDIVPNNTTFVSFSSPGGWSATTPAIGSGGGIIQASNPSLTVAAGPQTLTLVVNVNPGTTSAIDNTTTVTSDISDPVTSNNVANTTTTVTAPTADLSVAKTDSPDPVTAGQNITYTITVNNAGPNTASTVSLSDTIPTGTTFVSFTSPVGWTPSTPPVGGTGTVTATNPSLTVAAGAQTFTLVVNVNAATTGTVTNTATITSATSDSNNANNSATAPTTVNALVVNADLAITKAAGAGPFTAGGNVNFTITVTNNGPAAATNVSVVDTLPAGSTFVSATPSQGSCSGTGPVTCALGGLAASGTATIALVVQSPATAGTITNSATVSATQTDPNAANNTATANATTTAASPPADIPTLSLWMLLALIAALGVVGLARR
jgi:uncharacterized repeat protein (TIGR01451 family)